MEVAALRGRSHWQLLLEQKVQHIHISKGLQSHISYLVTVFYSTTIYRPISTKKKKKHQHGLICLTFPAFTLQKAPVTLSYFTIKHYKEQSLTTALDNSLYCNFLYVSYTGSETSEVEMTRSRKKEVNPDS